MIYLIEENNKIYLCDKNGFVVGLLDSGGFSYGLPINEKINMEISDFTLCGNYWNYEGDKTKRGDIYRPKEYTPEMEKALEEHRIVCIKRQQRQEKEFFEKLQNEFTEEITSILESIRNSNDEDALEILSKFSSKERMRGRTHYGELW